MINLEESKEDLLDFKDDRGECATLGDVKNVVPYNARDTISPTSSHPSWLLIAPFIRSFLQQEPDGIMAVKFRDPTSAKARIIVSYPFHRCSPASVFHSPPISGERKRGFFAGRRAEAYFYTGQQRFRRSKS